MRYALLCGALLVLAGAARAGDWPQWRGPNQNGSSEERGLPATWSADRNVAWVVDLPGPAAATPVVSGNRVFVSTTDAGGRDLLALCLSVKDGKVLWRRKASTVRFSAPDNTMASPSPVTDGKRAYFLYGTGDLVAYDASSGEPVWSRALAREYGELSVKFGYSSSPLWHDEKLYVQVLRRDHPWDWSGPGPSPVDSFLLALDAATGKTLWKHNRPTDARDESQDSYTTPVVQRHGGRTQVVVMGGDCVTGHDPATGAEIWRIGYNPAQRSNWRVVCSPVPGDGLIYAVVPRGQNPLFAIPAGRTGTLSWSDLAWEYRPDTPDVCAPLLYRGRLYVLGDATPAVSCLDAQTGRLIWKAELNASGAYRASPLGADGKIYCINEAGDVTVFAAGDTRRVLGQVSMGEGPCRSSPIAAAGRLFIRTARRLWCLQQQTGPRPRP